MIITKLTNQNREIVERRILNDRLLAMKKPPERMNINNPDSKSSLFIAESERFNKDFASYDAQRRIIDKDRKKQMYENFKNSLFDRDKKRWDRMNNDYIKEEDKIKQNREHNLVGRKNQPG
jgi:hypothetical protein